MAAADNEGKYTTDISLRVYHTLSDVLQNINSTGEVTLPDPEELNRQFLIYLVTNLINSIKAPVIVLKAEISIYNINDPFFNSPRCTYHLQICHQDRYIITKK